jgi:hypothetical protein
VSITKKLGVDYMHIVLRQMKLALHSGFMVHVLSYSVHAVLRAMYGDNKRIERSKDGSQKTSGGGGGGDEMDIDKEEEEAEDVQEQHAQHAQDEQDEQDEQETIVQPSAVDLNLTHIVPILDDDIFGRVAQQRNAEGYRPKSQLIEAKTCKSYDSFELLARSLTFLPCLSIHVLVSPMVEKLDDRCVTSVLVGYPEYVAVLVL